MTKTNRKKILGNLSLYLLVLIQVLILPIYVLAQSDPDDIEVTAHNPEEAFMQEVGDDFFEDALDDPRFMRQIDGIHREDGTAQFEAEFGSQNPPAISPGIDSVYMLYPQGTQNITGRNLENFANDFVSCVLSLVVVKASQSLLRGIAHVGSSITNALADMPVASGFWHLGSLVIPTTLFADKKVHDPEERLQKQGSFLMNLVIGPSGENIAFCAQSVVNAYLQATVIRWVNEGFNQAAVWAEDLRSILFDIYALSYRKAIGDVNLCVDVRASVHLSVDLDFLRTQPEPPRGGCTITISEQRDLELLFGGGDSRYDPGLFQKLYSNPHNTGMGGFLTTTSTANKYMEQNEKSTVGELNWFAGMWPHRDSQGKIVTPGNVIHDKIVKALSLETNHSALASDWDHVIFMISNQLIRREVGKVINPFSN